MIYLTIRCNALNFVQCMQNHTPMVALFFFTFFNEINSIHISDFCDIRIVNIGKQTLKTSTLCMWFGIRIFFFSFKVSKAWQNFQNLQHFFSNVHYENKSFSFFPNIFVAKWHKFTNFFLFFGIYICTY